MAGIFEKIVAGDIPSHKIYEDELVYAFLDINPLSPGHALVIPKKCYEFLHEVPENTSAAIGRVLPKIAKAVMTATGTKDYNILQNNGSAAHQAVPHVHFHIIPKPSEQQGLGVGWPAGALGDGAAMKEKIIAALAA
eukprot:TRINITY_DN17947_c0_g1_i1.p1 TRINITY_DN17947_c0_g1~~TRINITY_DN17947_c0_g1_i1.p1  ORF type:complete len:160 (+),score=43.58 TRINITY_DN17947_c0_g1_i1:71-481(+)